MTNRTNKVFIDSNMLMFAAEFQKADVFEWMDQLYGEIYIHQEVLNELILPSIKSKIVEQEDYCISTDEADLPIIQDSAEDFCFYCYKNEIASRKDVRKFFGHIFRETPGVRKQKMEQLDKRLQ